ncbi:MAG: hypothetical protein DME65_07670 [Verrucomicrobia bacterium]|nr:MAG: hypothetical protein DME65_07670 [Verrucomicrobiota bacterium]
MFLIDIRPKHQPDVWDLSEITNPATHRNRKSPRLEPVVCEINPRDLFADPFFVSDHILRSNIVLSWVVLVRANTTPIEAVVQFASRRQANVVLLRLHCCRAKRQQQVNCLHCTTVRRADFACQMGNRVLSLLRNTYGMKKKITGKDLTKEPPRSPRIRVGGYAILGRTIDKCRALVAGNIGEYHFDCPLDNVLFGFKGVKGDDFKAQIEQGASDQEVVEWLNQNGEEKTPAEIKRWADEVEASSLYNHPEDEKRDYFSEQVKKLGLDPAKTTTFEWLEVDDRVSHQ